jgi:hypothetical protein
LAATISSSVSVNAIYTQLVVRPKASSYLRQATFPSDLGLAAPRGRRSTRSRRVGGPGLAMHAPRVGERRERHRGTASIHRFHTGRLNGRASPLRVRHGGKREDAKMQ